MLNDPALDGLEEITRVGEAISSAAGAVIIAFLALVLSTLALCSAPSGPRWRSRWRRPCWPA